MEQLAIQVPAPENLHRLKSLMHQMCGSREARDYTAFIDPVQPTADPVRVLIRATELPAGLSGAPMTAPQAGETRPFVLYASPSKKVNAKNNRLRKSLPDPESRMRWLHDKARVAGCWLSDDTTITATHRWPTQRDDDRFTFTAVQVSGRLTVTDPDAFAHALLAGIGPGATWGIGGLFLVDEEAP